MVVQKHWSINVNSIPMGKKIYSYVFLSAYFLSQLTEIVYAVWLRPPVMYLSGRSHNVISTLRPGIGFSPFSISLQPKKTDNWVFKINLMLSFLQHLCLSVNFTVKIQILVAKICDVAIITIWVLLVLQILLFFKNKHGE